MRNLRIVCFEESKIASQNGDFPLKSATWDIDDDSILCTLGPTSSNPSIQLKRQRCKNQNSERSNDTSQIESLIASWDAPCPLPDFDSDEILLTHYFVDRRETCIVLAGGDLVLVREYLQLDHERIEIVGSIDVGVAAASWSPDEELLSLVTRQGSLILMSRELEPITEVAFSQDDLKLSKHVSVGWGKKETQFQGKRAKAMRDPTMPETVDEGRTSSQDAGGTTISWRGDGAYFAVNSPLISSRRVIRVFNREGVLESVSEPVDGLESAMSWRPYGNVIASVKRSETSEAQSQLEVVFLEKNGLRHGGFDLRLNSSEIATFGKNVCLSWNIDSTILAVQFTDRVQFWTMGNYHYYLKQEIFILGVIAVLWHPENPLRCCLSNDNSIQDIEFSYIIDRGSVVPPFDYGMVSVIDGKKLKVTPLKHAGVPPPMAFLEIDADSNIIATAFSRTCQRLAYLTDKHLYLTTWEMREAKSNSSEIRHTSKVAIRKVNLPSISGQLPRYTQMTIQNDDSLYLFAPAKCSTAIKEAVCQKLTWVNTIHNSTDAVFHQVQIPSYTQNLLADVTQEEIFVQSQGLTKSIAGADISISLAGDEYQSSVFRNPFDDSLHKISISTRGRLLLDNRVLTRESTSFAVTSTHLLFTTSRNLLKFAHLNPPENLEIPGDTPEVDERCRAVERGAKIVTVSPSIYAVVLQMPRGNLETIYPRILVVSGIRGHIREADYRSAFLACQNHQVDLNILYDYQPEQFLSKIETFIDQLEKPSRVDEFISKLKEEDVTKTLYRDTLASAPELNNKTLNGYGNSESTQMGKINKICDALIDVLKTKPSSYLQNIITAHVCKRPPNLGAALTLVSSLRQISTEEADLAVSHLCFLSDTNRLFDAALALYDLELTLLVAQNAQRDPREYMPFLQSLQALPSLRRQYTIDNHLQNYAKALISLHALDAHDEVESYVVKHSLYAEALTLYKYTPTQHVKITRLYAKFLSDVKSEPAAAATLYESLQDYSSAYPLYAIAHQWRESLTNACLAELEPESTVNLAKSLAISCAEVSRDYRSAATIHIDYLGDIPSAARLLCKGSYFAEAMRLLSHPAHKLSAEIPTIIDPALSEKFGEIIELIADCKTQLASQIPRIEELRKKKAEDPLAFYGGDASAAGLEGGADIPDNISLAATDTSTVGGQSLFTRYESNASRFGGTVASNVSRKTSKTKRREERKRARGKKGSVYEEEYLIASVGRLIERVNGTHDEVNRLVGALVRRGLREQAEKVGQVMSEIETSCLEAKIRVWGPADEQNEGETDEGDMQRPSGADGVFWDSQRQIDSTLSGETSKKNVPVIRSWKSTVVVF